MRWHPGYRALVLVATRVDGTVQRTQRVHLTTSGGKATAEDLAARNIPNAKVTNGPQAGAVVRLPGDTAGPLLLAEGPETGLACWVSTRHETWIALGGIGGVELPHGRRVVAIADDNPLARDAKQGGAAKALLKAVSAWRKAGIDLVVATPWAKRRRDKSDMADVILAHGPNAVWERIQAALRPSGAKIDRVPLAEAERAVAASMAVFFAKITETSARRMGWTEQRADKAKRPVNRLRMTDREWFANPVEPVTDEEWAARFDEASSDINPLGTLASHAAGNAPLTHGTRLTVGGGKTYAMQQEAANVLAQMRQHGDDRVGVIAVPAHRLGDEQAAALKATPAFRAAGLEVAAWRGRDAPDPAAPGYSDPSVPSDDKIKMCGDLDRVADAVAVGLTVETAACKSSVKDNDGKKRVVKCPLYDTCAYQAQRRVKADLWVIAHDSLYHQKPKPIGDVGFTVVDEASWMAGLIGTGAKPWHLTLDTLAGTDMGALVGADRDRLLELRRRLYALLSGLPTGAARRDAALASGITQQDAVEALALEHKRRMGGMHAGQNREERKATRNALGGNATISAVAAVWIAIWALLAEDGPEASGWLAMADEPTPDGPVRVLVLKGRRDIAKGYRAETVLLDAHLSADLVRPYWPNVELTADINVAAPHQHICQVADRSFGQSMLEPLSRQAARADPGEAQRHMNRLRDVRAILVREARHVVPGRVLVVAQKAVEEALIKMGGLPGNITMAHHNNVAGRDEWKDVVLEIIVGRTSPGPAVVERIAEALTGEAVLPLGQGKWYDRVDTVREMENGSFIQAEADRHPHPVAEAVRWQICEGQVLQIIGRPRGVRRTEANPVDILVLTDVVLPLPLAKTLNYADIAPSPDDKMLAAGGIVFGNTAHRAKAYADDLWETQKAAKWAKQRWQGTAHHDGLALVEYQLAGAGQKAAQAWADLTRCPNPAEFIAERLKSALAWCRVAGIPVDAAGQPIADRQPDFGVLSQMAAQGRVLFSPADAFRCYPDLFVSERAAMRAIQREMARSDLGTMMAGGVPHSPISSINRGMGDSSPGGWYPNHHLLVRYRPAGRGQQSRRALVTLDRLDGLAEWLSEKLKAVVTVELVKPDPVRPPAPEPPPSTLPVADDSNVVGWTAAGCNDDEPLVKEMVMEPIQDAPAPGAEKREQPGLDPGTIYRGPMA